MNPDPILNPSLSIRKLLNQKLKERSEVKMTKGSKLPRKITVEQRNEIIRFIRTRTDIESRQDRLRQAIEEIAPGKLSVPASSGATVARWYAYIGNSNYDPDAALSEHGGARRGLTPEQQDQVTAYMQAHKDEYPSQVLCLQSAVDVLNVPLTVNSFNANTYLHRKLKAPVTIPAVGLPEGRRAGKLATNSKEGKAVRDQVSAWMHEHVKEFDTKVELFKAAVEKFGLNIVPNSSGAFSYWNRLTKNAAARNGKAKEVQIIILNGREYTDTELEELLKEQRNSVQPVNFCPNCGFRMELHNKAYTIANRHAQE